MSLKGYFYLTFIPIFIILIATESIIPKLTRKEVFFGIKIPPEERESVALKGVYKGYLYATLTLGTALIIVFFILSVFYDIQLLVVIFIFVFIIIMFIPYIAAHKKVRKIKAESNWYSDKKQIVTVDTEMSRYKNLNSLASPWWLMVELIIVLINFILPYIYYDKIPVKIPQKYGFDGTVTKYMDKTFGTVTFFGFTTLFLFVIMFFTYYSIAKAKQFINFSSPKKSKLQSMKFRKLWSRATIILGVALMGYLTIINFMSLSILPYNKTILIGTSFIFPLVILIGFLALGIYTGQGGSRLKVDYDTQDNNKNDMDFNDDHYWKFFGTVYYNPNDPAIFIEKRIGIGWTMNFGNKKALAIWISIIVLIIFFVVLSISLTS